MAPTRRFIQLDLIEAREAKVWIDMSSPGLQSRVTEQALP